MHNKTYVLESLNVAPFAVTFGIYRLMFHTHFCTHEAEARSYIERTMKRIEKIFLLYNIPEIQRDDSWQQHHDNLLIEFTE